MKSAIQLIEYKWLDIEFHPQGIDGEPGEASIQHALNVERSPSNPQNWLVRLDVLIEDSDSDRPTPYVGQLAIGGHFELPEDFPEDKACDMVHFNAGAILYGAMRELVLTLTSRSIHGSFTLPSIDARSFLPVEENTPQEKPYPCPNEN